MAKQLIVDSHPVRLIKNADNDYISLTDMMKKFGDDFLIYNWIRNKNTVDFLGVWEKLHNPDFKPIEFDRFRLEAGSNSFALTPKKWVEATGAIGIVSKAGRYGGGTYAHSEIAMEFGSWLSPTFKLYLLKEFKRLKEQEQERLSETWNLTRELSKLNYRIHTDAIRDNLIPPEVRKLKGVKNPVYATEADILNKALFGMTAREWRKDNPDMEGNMRDLATATQLIVLSNLESLNAEYIKLGLAQEERLERLNQTAISQLKSLVSKQKKINKLTSK